MQARGQLRLTWRLYAESPQSGEISRLYGQESIEEGDLSTQRIIGAIPICLPCRHAAPLEMTMLAGSIGHTFGMRVDGTSSRRFLRFISLTGPSAPRVVDCPSGNTYKISVTGLAFSVIWHDKHSGDWLTAFATPLSGCAIGHAFGARVQRVQKIQKVQRVQRVVVAPFGRRL